MGVEEGCVEGGRGEPGLYRGERREVVGREAAGGLGGEEEGAEGGGCDGAQEGERLHCRRGEVPGF